MDTLKVQFPYRAIKMRYIDGKEGEVDDGGVDANASNESAPDNNNDTS